AVVVATQEAEQTIAVMREVGVHAHPAAVAAAVEAGDLVPPLGPAFAVNPDVVVAAERDRGVAHVDSDLLAAAAAQPPQLASGERGRGNGRLRERPDRK